MPDKKQFVFGQYTVQSQEVQQGDPIFTGYLPGAAAPGIDVPS